MAAGTVTVAMGVTTAGIVGLNMFLLSDKLCQAFTRNPQGLQVPYILPALCAPIWQSQLMTCSHPFQLVSMNGYAKSVAKS